MDLLLMQQNYRSRCLVTIDNEQSIVNVYKYQKCQFEEAFLVLKPSEMLSVFISKSCICSKTEVWVDCDISDCDGDTLLVRGDINEYVSTSGFDIIKFAKEDKIIDYI